MIRPAVAAEESRLRAIQSAALDDPWPELIDVAIDGAPHVLVLDDDCSQKGLDVAAQRGVEVVVATGDGEYVKQPTGVRVRTV